MMRAVLFAGGWCTGCARKMPAVPYQRAASAARKNTGNARLQPRFITLIRREVLRSFSCKGFLHKFLKDFTR
jgi:hypothetical protein